MPLFTHLLAPFRQKKSKEASMERDIVEEVSLDNLPSDLQSFGFSPRLCHISSSGGMNSLSVFDLLPDNFWLEKRRDEKNIILEKASEVNFFQICFNFFFCYHISIILSS